MTGKNRILLILHQPTSTPGRIGRWLAMRGFRLEARYPVLGDVLPETLTNYRGVIVFGGPGSVNDDCAHYRQVIDWLDVPLRENVPYIGICLGGQMLAHALGARVAPHPRGRWEVGYYPVRPTRAGRGLWNCWPEMVFQWHAEGFDLPAGGELLLRGLGDFPNQAFRYGERAFGLQFHPEVTMLMLHRWCVLAADKLRMPGARPRRDLIEGKLAYDPAVACWLDSFLDHWLTLGRSTAADTREHDDDAQHQHRNRRVPATATPARGDMSAPVPIRSAAISPVDAESSDAPASAATGRAGAFS